MSAYEWGQLIWQIVIIVILGLTVWKYHQQIKVFTGQLEAMRDGVKPQNLLSIVQFLQDPEIRNARDYVIETVPKKNEKTAF